MVGAIRDAIDLLEIVLRMVREVVRSVKDQSESGG